METTVRIIFKSLVFGFIGGVIVLTFQHCVFSPSEKQKTHQQIEKSVKEEKVFIIKSFENGWVLDYYGELIIIKIKEDGFYRDNNVKVTTQELSILKKAIIEFESNKQ